MGRQGGQGKGKPKLRDRSFGKALIKQLHGNNSSALKEMRKMNSILDNSALEDFIITAEMDDSNVEVVHVHDKDAYLAEPTVKKFQSMEKEQFKFEHLQIPRKPSWNRDMTAEEVDKREKKAFLAWRRDIAILENSELNRKVTPYEKNIEVWRQLWRVLEKCDMAIQIVDARNPLLYFTQDLLHYALDLQPPKPIILLINKSDFLTEYQRKLWVKYLRSQNIAFIFYSAHYEQEKLDHMGSFDKENIRMKASHDDDFDSLKIATDIVNTWNSLLDSKEIKMIRIGTEIETSTSDLNSMKSIIPLVNNDNDNDQEFLSSVELEEGENDEGQEEEEDGRSTFVYDDQYEYHEHDGRKNEKSSTNITFQQDEMSAAKILNRLELIDLLDCLSSVLGIESQPRHLGRVCFGMVGYPNVGKSSVINTILGVSKSSHGMVRVAVSSTPGKTKHFQTINVNESLMLCDCPGLVFPSFMNNTGEMLCAGILPINQMRDHIEPATIIASRVPIHVLDAIYGIHIKKILDFKDDPDRPPTASEFLSAYCELKGYITGGTGRWDEFRACKDILRDFNDGRILYTSSPPISHDMDRWMSDSENLMAKKEKVAERLVTQRLKEIKSEESDEVVVFGKSYQYDDDEEEIVKIEEVEKDNEDDGQNEKNSKEISINESDMTTPILISEEKMKREHKRLKHWGKKGKKLRDKNPYSEENGTVSYVAYSTNRSIPGNSKFDKVKRNDPQKQYGSPFTRPSYPFTQPMTQK